MTHYAVLIGNNEFPNERSLKPLTCPPADVEGMKMVLTAENHGQFLAEHVLVLLNKESREVIREINRVLKNASKHDLVLFYYSGHGLPNSQNNLFLSTLDTEADLLESTAVSFNQVYELINTFYCKKIVIILDCCYSGAAGKVFKGDIGSQLQTLNSRATGTFLITATSEIQVALDVNEGSRFSLFTKHLIEGLESGAAAKNDDGLISVDDIFRYVAKKLSFENAKQVPRKFGKNESGELFIAKSGRDAKKEQLTEIKTYFSTLFAHHQIGQDTFIEMTQLLDKTRFSDFERQQYDLIVEVFESKKLAGFERKWDRLLLEVENEQKKLAEEAEAKAEIDRILAEEKAAQEKLAKEKKLAQEIREHERLEEEKAAKAKVERERLAREKTEIEKKLVEEKAEKEQTEKLAREKAAQEKIAQEIRNFEFFIEWVNINNISPGRLPRNIDSLKNLKNFTIYFYKIKNLPEFIGNLTQLTSLDIRHTQLTYLPESIGNLTQLTSLDISNNKLTYLPESIGNLTQLTSLDISSITSLPESIGNLTQLTKLSISCTQLTSLPESIGNLTQLTSLDISHNKLTSLPESIGNLTQLTNLDIRNNQLTVIPKEIGNLTNLTTLDLTQNQLTALPEEISNLMQLTDLNIDWYKLIYVPESIRNLKKFTGLKICNIIKLPEWIGNLRQLEYLDISNNQLTVIPKEIGNLTQLTRLDITNNQLTVIPKEIGNLTNLTMLNLRQNELTSFPEPILNITQLKWLDIRHNRLGSFKSNWLGSLLSINIDIDQEKLTHLPKSIGHLTRDKEGIYRA